MHIDLCGPTRTRIFQGDRYFMLLIVDYSRMNWLNFLKEKYKALDKFKQFKAVVENEIDIKIKFLRSKRGGDFTSIEFNNFCEDHGIKRHFSTPRTH